MIVTVLMASCRTREAASWSEVDCDGGGIFYSA
jgi:hypothetical protein